MPRFPGGEGAWKYTAVTPFPVDQLTVPPSNESGFLKSYLEDGRSVSLNLFFIVPILVLYEIGIQLSESGLRNAAEVILKDCQALMGEGMLRFFHWFLMALVLLCCLRVLYRERPIFSYFFVMVMESLIFAFMLGPILSMLIGGIFLDFPLTSGGDDSLSVRMLLSLGAGVYEELLFRLVLLGGLFYIFIRVFNAPRGFSAGLAVALSSVLFAAYHHIGPLGQEMTPYLFFFRLGAGIILGLVFMVRGLGVAVYLHLFYDVLRDIELALHGDG